MTPETTKSDVPSVVDSLIKKISQMTETQFLLFISLAEKELGLQDR